MTFSELGIDLPDAFQGDQYTQCPKCSPTRKKKKVKCLSANSEKGVFNCHHCGWSGNTKTGTQSKGDPNAWKRKEYRRPTFKQNKLPIDIVSWFKNRGISEDTLVRNDISYGRVYMPQQEDFVPAHKLPGVCISAPEGGLFSTAELANPMADDPFRWAFARNVTLTVYSAGINEHGGSEQQIYHRTLTEDGLDVTFVRLADEDVKIRVVGVLRRTD